MAESWSPCLRKFHDSPPAQQFQTWITPLIVGEENGTWMVYGKNQFACNMLQSRLAADVRAVHTELAPQQAAFLFRTGMDRSYPITSDVSGKSLEEGPSENTLAHPHTIPTPLNKTVVDILAERMKNLPYGNRHTGPEPAPAVANPIAKTRLDEQCGVAETRYSQTNLPSDYTLETLVEGRDNRIAAAAVQSTAENPSQSYNPSFLYGSTGLGKTHPAQAIDNELLKSRSDAKARCMHSDDYIRSFISAVHTNSYDALRQRYKQYDLLIVDDIQFIKGRDHTMEELFYLYNHFHNEKKQLILTCDVLPAKIEDINDRLKSHFLWGLTLELELPELEMRVAILQKKAKPSGISLTDKAAFFIANLIRSNVCELESMFNRVSASSHFMNKPIDISLTCDASQGIIAVRHKTVTTDTIIDVTAKYCWIKISDMLNKKRTHNIAYPHQVAMSLTKELTNLDPPSIGDAFGGRDRTTVIYGVKAVAKLREDDPKLAQDYGKLLVMAQNWPSGGPSPTQSAKDCLKSR